MRAALFTVCFSAACALDPGPPSVQCTSRFDCASGETCSNDGLCLPGRAIVRVQPDAGMPSAQPPKDAGLPDSGVITSPPDAGDTVPPDSGVVDPPDSGCSPAITVVELAGRSFCTIGEAIAAAPVDGTVDVPAGTFNEALIVDKTLSVRGAGTAAVTVRAPSSRVALTINAVDVSIFGMTFEANAAEGANLVGSAVLQDVTIKNATGAGIRVPTAGSILNTRNVVVSRVLCAAACSEMDWGEGIVFESGTSGVLIDTTIEDTDFIGLYLANAIVQIDNGRIRRAGRTYCPQNERMCVPGALIFADSTLIVQLGTQVHECGGSGIETYNSELEVRASRLENNGIRLVPFVDGIHAGTSKVILDNNVINGNAGYGIGCEGSVAVTGCENNTHGNNGEGWTNGNCGGC